MYEKCYFRMNKRVGCSQEDFWGEVQGVSNRVILGSAVN